MRSGALRPILLFAVVAGLGLTLAALLSGGRPASPSDRPRLPVVVVPGGTDVPGSGGIPGISLVGAEGIVVSDVREVDLEDGTRVPFRPMVLRARSQRPLPSPGKGIQRVALEGPDLVLLPVPATRAEWASPPRPMHLAAPHGILDQGPGEAMGLRLSGGVIVEVEREGSPWTFAGETVDADLRARSLRSAGRVRISSPDLEAEGSDLEAAEGTGTLTLAGGARGEIHRTTGARIAEAPAGEGIRFSCAGPFRVLRMDPLPPPPPGAARADTPTPLRIVLEEDAELLQGDGRLGAGRIEVDLQRREGAAEGDGEPLRVAVLRAAGSVALTGGKDGRSIAARGETLEARPDKTGATAVLLEGNPEMDVLEGDPGVPDRALRVACRGPARLHFPAAEGEVRASFTGSAEAHLLDAGPGPDGAVRRTLRARSLLVEAHRPGGGAPPELRQVTAEGDAELREGDRSARARGLVWKPEPGGGSRIDLTEAVAVHWPGAGFLDPVGASSPERGAAPGSLLLTSPRSATLLLPPPGDAENGARISVAGGATLRRVVGEQEIYRLTCGRIEASLHPGNRSLSRLEAVAVVRLEGREEGPGARRYDLRGHKLTVLGAPDTKEPRTADVEGDGTGRLRAFASFAGEDGRPVSVEAERLRFDRATGALLAEGTVEGTGVLPAKAPVGAAGGPGGKRATLACRVLRGTLERVGTGGATRVRDLDAEGDVEVRAGTETASGDRLRWDAAAAEALLEGKPARVTAGGGSAAVPMEDRCEAPVLRITIAGESLEEARADRGGLFVRHRVPADAASGADLPPERYEARCTGVLAYRPAETRMQGDVVLARAVLKDGKFVPRDRLEGADAVRVLHPPADGGGGGRAASAEAVAAEGGMRIDSPEAGWKADGVSRITLDAASDAVTLEASPGHPRFRVEGAGTRQAYRRVVYDYRQGIFTEQVGATIESR